MIENMNILNLIKSKGIFFIHWKAKQLENKTKPHELYKKE